MTDNEQNRELLERALDYISENDAEGLNILLKHVHAADIAELMQLMSNHYRTKLVTLLGGNFNPDILTYLDESVRDTVIDSWAHTQLSAALNTLDEVDAIEILSDLEPEERRGLLRTLKPEVRALLEGGLIHPEDSAGRLMQHEFIALPANWTVSQAHLFLQTAQNFPEDLNEIFIVDTKREPIGRIPFTKLIRGNSKQQLSEIHEDIVTAVHAHTSVDDVCIIFQKYFLDALPVLDDKKRMIGLIKAHNIIDVFYENAQESFLQSAGVSESDFYETLSSTTIARIKWIAISASHSLTSAAVLYQFQDIIGANLVLNPLQQILSAICGTVGLQVVTVTVRALLARDLVAANTGRAISRELILGLINGLICSFTVSVILFFLLQGTAKVCQITFIFGFSTFTGIIFSSLIGTILPVVLNRFNVDPAISAGPLMSALSDTISLFIMLAVASLML